MSPLILKVPKKANFGKSTAASSSIFLKYLKIKENLFHYFSKGYFKYCEITILVSQIRRVLPFFL